MCYQPHILITHCKSRITVDCLALLMLCILDLSAVVSIFRVKECQTVQELNQKSGSLGVVLPTTKRLHFLFSFFLAYEVFFNRRLQLKLKNLKLHEKYILILGMYRTSGGVYVPCVHAR